MRSMSPGWRVELDRAWDVLGPLPIHAREQHFLSPAYPLDLSLPISTTTRYPSSLTHTAYAEWSHTTADPHGTIHVSHPSVPWDQIRATEGWAGLQHLNVLRSWLSVVPPSDLARDSPDPLLRTELLQGAFFTILPPPDSPQRKVWVPEWHYGNIYTLERAPTQTVRLPASPTKNNKETRYEVIICAPYEIRLFGDPSAYSSTHPILTLNFSVSLQFPCSPIPSQHPIENIPLQHVLPSSVIPHIIDGTPFGDAVGIGVRCFDFRNQTKDQGYWSVVHAHLVRSSTSLPLSLSVALLDEVPVRIAPTQTRIIPLRLRISSLERIPREVEQLDIELACVTSLSWCQTASEKATPSKVQHTTQGTLVLRATLPLTHVPLWTEEKYVPIQASYFFAKSMPTIFLLKPPQKAFDNDQSDPVQHGRAGISKCKGNEPILALHGAGVDILTQSFWIGSLPRQQYAWVILPQGRTSWGLDWHGPSATDALAAVSALSHILSNSGSERWAKWSFDANTRVILMGHSNGGQGAWHIASRWPDRVCAVVSAAGYIKSQAYVSWCMSRFAHFIDPALRAVLDSSLTPDDNDLFLGNLVGKPVLALNGGADDNVPTWHTREQVGILRTWDPDADVTYHEDPGRPHWYFDILSNERVQAFLDRVYFSSMSSPNGSQTQGREKKSFTLTVAVPTESGSLNGYQIHALTVPGLLGRLRVTTGTCSKDVSIQTTNVSVFSLDSGVLTTRGDVQKAIVLTIDSDDVSIDLCRKDDTILFVRNPQRKPPWKISPRPLEAVKRLQTPRQRLQSILSTRAPFTILVPSLRVSPELSAALRIAHALELFHALETQIVSVPEVERVDMREGNLVVIGCAETPVVRQWLERAGGLWTYEDGAWSLGVVRFERPSSAILFCQPHPYDVHGIALFLQSTDTSGLERAVRLFPIRTGVLSPDWLVIDGRADTIGAAGVQGAGVYGWTHSDLHGTGTWTWNERMSWLD